MTTEAFTPTPIRIIAGTGPYSVDHPYQEGGLIVRVLGTSTITVLDPADYTVNPVSSDITGDVTLSAGAATTYAGDDLQILRKTNPEQGWQGQGGAREKSLEAQLDIVTQAIQDTEAELDRTFKVASGVIGDLPGDRAGKALIFDVDGSPIPGPDADAITDAQANATLAAQAAQDAADAAALAATFDPANFQPVDTTLDQLSGATITSAGLALLDDISAAAQRATLGVLSAALKALTDNDDLTVDPGNVGTRGNVAAALSALKSDLFQTVNNVTGSRASSTDYTNNTGSPMFVTVEYVSDAQVSFLVDGIVVVSHEEEIGSIVRGAVHAIIPDQSVYRFTGAPQQRWIEVY